MRISEDDLGWNWETLETVFGDAHNATLWIVSLTLAVLLRVVTTRWHHQLIFPLCEFFRFPFPRVYSASFVVMMTRTQDAHTHP